jgi:hypothetical protein
MFLGNINMMMLFRVVVFARLASLCRSPAASAMGGRFQVHGTGMTVPHISGESRSMERYVIFRISGGEGVE